MKIPPVRSSKNRHRKKIRRLKVMLLKYRQLDKRMVCLMVSVLKIISCLKARVLKMHHLNQISQIKSLKRWLKIITVKLFIQHHLQIWKYIQGSSLEENHQVLARTKIWWISSLVGNITNIKPQIINTLEKRVIRLRLNCSLLQTTFIRKSPQIRLPGFTLSKWRIQNISHLTH